MPHLRAGRRVALTHRAGPPNISAASGRMAEWLCRGLQILVQRFDSASGLHTGRGMAAPNFHIEEGVAGGSSVLAPHREAETRAVNVFAVPGQHRDGPEAEMPDRRGWRRP